MVKHRIGEAKRQAALERRIARAALKAARAAVRREHPKARWF